MKGGTQIIDHHLKIVPRILQSVGLFSLCKILCRKQFFNACSNIYTALFHLNVFININTFPPQHYDIAKNYPESTDWELKIIFGYDVKDKRKFPRRLTAEFKVWAPACHRVEGSCLRVCLSLSSSTTHKEPRAEHLLDIRHAWSAGLQCRGFAQVGIWLLHRTDKQLFKPTIQTPDVQGLLCIHLRQINSELKK